MRWSTHIYVLYSEWKGKKNRQRHNNNTTSMNERTEWNKETATTTTSAICVIVVVDREPPGCIATAMCLVSFIGVCQKEKTENKSSVWWLHKQIEHTILFCWSIFDEWNVLLLCYSQISSVLVSIIIIIINLSWFKRKRDFSFTNVPIFWMKLKECAIDTKMKYHFCVHLFSSVIS